MEIRRALPVSPSAGAQAREVLDGWLSELVGAVTADGARLAATELIENAVRHGDLGPTDTITLSGVATEDIVRIEIEQPSSAAGVHVVHEGERDAAQGGFGLRIVEGLATKWGVRPDSPGAVWFELDRGVAEL